MHQFTALHGDRKTQCTCPMHGSSLVTESDSTKWFGTTLVCCHLCASVYTRRHRVVFVWWKSNSDSESLIARLIVLVPAPSPANYCFALLEPPSLPRSSSSITRAYHYRMWEKRGEMVRVSSYITYQWDDIRRLPSREHIPTLSVSPLQFLLPTGCQVSTTLSSSPHRDGTHIPVE